MLTAENRISLRDELFEELKNANIIIFTSKTQSYRLSNINKLHDYLKFYNALNEIIDFIIGIRCVILLRKKKVIQE